MTSSKEGVDTYISLILLPDKSKATKRKTAVKKKDLNPEFNERCEEPVCVCVHKCEIEHYKDSSFFGSVYEFIFHKYSLINVIHHYYSIHT